MAELGSDIMEGVFGKLQPEFRSCGQQLSHLTFVFKRAPGKHVRPLRCNWYFALPMCNIRRNFVLQLSREFFQFFFGSLVSEKDLH